MVNSPSCFSTVCHDPGLLSTIFPEPGESLMVGLQDSLYSVYSPHTQYQFVPDLGSVAVAVTSVPELSYQLQADTVTLTIPEAGPSCEELRLQVLAKTWTTELSAFLESELWTDTDIYCRGGQRLVAHRVMLAAASPLLASCLSQDGTERAAVMLPDFSYHEVRQFLQTIYLGLRHSQASDHSDLLQLLTQFESPDMEEINISVKNDKVKNEEKVKKLHDEVKMEVSQENNIEKKNLSEQNTKSKSDKKGGHTCTTCGKTFKLIRVLKEHMNIHGEPKFHCDYRDCKRKFHLKANLKAHIDVVHLKSKNIPCELCGKMFYNQTHLRSHMEHHNKDKHICHICSSHFSCSKSLREHIKFKHNPESLPKCTVCHKTYSTPQNLKSHFSRVHMQEKKYICPDCGKAFFEKAELDFHSSSHNPKDLNVTCDICKLKFKNNKTLYYHKKRTHDPNNKIHICYQCGKSYADSHHLNRHMESHGQKSSFCKTCGKGFQSEQKVKAHVRKVHEKWRKSNELEKPCALCSKKFATFGSMKRHLKDVHKMTNIEANSILLERFNLDPKKHRMNPSEIMPELLTQEN